jgi:desulfoferrodoxin-like iron-binding protein
MNDAIRSFRGGNPPTLLPLPSTREGRGKKELSMPNQMGKRYMCSKCGVEVIITKAGGGMVVCCGQDMVMKK